MALSEAQLDERVKAAVADGFSLVQEGRIVRAEGPGVSFSERADGFRVGLLGSYGPPTYRSQFENRLYDSESRWVHMRRDRA